MLAHFSVISAYFINYMPNAGTLFGDVHLWHMLVHPYPPVQEARHWHHRLPHNRFQLGIKKRAFFKHLIVDGGQPEALDWCFARHVVLTYHTKKKFQLIFLGTGISLTIR